MWGDTRDVKTVLVDQDGPLADFDAAVYAVLFDAGYNLDTLTRTQWETSNDIRQQLGDNAANLIDTARRSAGFYRHLPVVAGAQNAIETLLDHGFHVAVCTTPSLKNPTCASDKLAWIEEHFPKLKKHFAVAYDKTLVRGAVLVDDKPIVTGSLDPMWQHIRFVTAHHRGIDIGANKKTLSMDGWEDITILLDVLS